MGSVELEDDWSDVVQFLAVPQVTGEARELKWLKPDRSSSPADR